MNWIVYYLPKDFKGLKPPFKFYTTNGVLNVDVNTNLDKGTLIKALMHLYTDIITVKNFIWLNKRKIAIDPQLLFKGNNGHHQNSNMFVIRKRDCRVTIYVLPHNVIFEKDSNYRPIDINEIYLIFDTLSKFIDRLMTSKAETRKIFTF